MKTVAYCFLALLIISGRVAYSQDALPDTIVFGCDSNFPPYEFFDKDGKPAGFHIDLIRAIAADMGLKVKIKLGDWPEIRNELEVKGTVQVSDMFYSKERDSVVDYAIPNEVTYDEIFIRKGQKGISAINDLSGKKVAVQTSSTLSEYLHHNYPEINFVLTANEPAALKLLSEGKCDAAIVSHVETVDIFEKLNIENLISIGHPLLPREYCFVVKEGNFALLKAINTGLIHLKDNQKFNELHEKWFAPKPEFQLSRYIVIPGLILVFIILIILLWNNTLRYAVKIKTKELEFTNSRLRLISTVKAARIDKLSTKDQTIEMIKQVKETFEVDACVVRVLLKDEMKLLGSIGVQPDTLTESIPARSVFTKEVLPTNKPKAHNDSDELITAEYLFENELANYNFRSFAGAQMLTEGRITGILCIYSEKEGREFTRTDLDHLQIVANQIGISIENNRLFEQNEKQKEILVKQIITNKKSKEEIQKLNEELEMKVKLRTSQLEASIKELETFTYSVSHDLKAPLRGIDGYSKLLLDLYKPGLNEEAQIFIETIRRSTLQMNQLINDLLDYSRLERSQLSTEHVKIKDLVKSVLSIYNADLEAGNFKINVNIPDIELITDSKGLTIALRNLVENAIKFTKGNIEPSIQIDVEENDLAWIISVNDNGIGFDMKYHQKIFEIFQRLQRIEEFPGTGIGLAMVSKAMQRMRGRAWAESTLGVGSSFYLEIPKKQ